MIRINCAFSANEPISELREYEWNFLEDNLTDYVKGEVKQKLSEYGYDYLANNKSIYVRVSPIISGIKYAGISCDIYLDDPNGYIVTYRTETIPTRYYESEGDRLPDFIKIGNILVNKFIDKLSDTQYADSFISMVEDQLIKRLSRRNYEFSPNEFDITWDNHGISVVCYTLHYDPDNIRMIDPDTPVVVNAEYRSRNESDIIRAVDEIVAEIVGMLRSGEVVMDVI